MKWMLTRSHAAFTAAVAASFAMASGCCSGHKSTSTAYYSDTPEGYGGTASASQPQDSSQLSMTGETNSVIPLYKETASIGKQEVDAGTVRVKKVVKTETVNQPVELRHEEIVIEREPASDSSDMSSAFQEKETVIHLTREEPVIQKQTTSAGQVVLKGRTESEQRNIQTQVRSEDVAVVKSGTSDNVTIGKNIQQSGEAVGGAESPSGQASGQSTGGTITNPAMLSGTGGSDLAGRSVQFSNLKVQGMIGDHLAKCDAGNGQSIYVYSSQGAGSLRSGDSINVNGIVKTSASNLSGTTAQVLSSQSAYIDAQKIQPASE